VSSEVEKRIALWIERAVIGLDLCPFAAAVWRSERARIAVSDAEDAAGAVESLLEEAAHLLDSDPAELSTTLVVFPRALQAFEEFLDAVGVAESALADAGAEGVLQIATFHPEYRFEGEEEDALSHFTNRAPYPVMHLLREAEVADAVDHHPDPHGIPARNVARLEALGRAGVAELVASWSGAKRRGCS
jgi:hypothetical protein